MVNTLTNKEIEWWSSVVQRYKTRCKCGHKVFIDKDKDKVLCSVSSKTLKRYKYTSCRNYVFKDKQAEFKYKMRQKLKN